MGDTILQAARPGTAAWREAERLRIHLDDVPAIRRVLARYIAAVGAAAAWDLAKKADDLYESCLAQDGKPRTRGGTFLHLARESLGEDQRRIVFRARSRKSGTTPGFRWCARLEHVEALLAEEAGTARSCVASVAGHPIVTALPDGTAVAAYTKRRTPSLPGGVPPPPRRAVVRVLLSPRHAQKIKGARRVAVEGHPTVPPEGAELFVLATSAVSRERS